MIPPNVDDLFVSWLASQMPDVGTASERPGDLEKRLPFVVIRRGGGGDLARNLDGPIIDVDCYAVDRAAVALLARRVDTEFRENTPTTWRGAQFTMLRCNQAPIKVPDSNTALRHMASAYSFSLQ